MIWLYGRHSCLSALSNPKRQIHQIIVSDKFGDMPEFKGKKVIVKDRRYLDELLGKDAVHQGIAIQASFLPLHDLSYLEQFVEPNQIVVILDQVSDPSNVGAILRSCAAFGVKALIAPDRHSPKETASLAKTASGALEIVPRIQVGNLRQAIEELQKMGFWTVGFSEEAKGPLHKANLTGKIALVMGSEGEGLRRLTQENCDFHVNLPTAEFSTLNVATATAIALYQTYLIQNT